MVDCLPFLWDYVSGLTVEILVVRCLSAAVFITLIYRFGITFISRSIKRQIGFRLMLDTDQLFLFSFFPGNSKSFLLLRFPGEIQ